MDAFAATHAGLAPVVVVPDHLGVPTENPLCSDATLGKVATYLVKDVPGWIEQNLAVDTDHRRWAIGGASNGGTCSLQVVTRAPEVYQTFLDMSGELHPSLGSEERTIYEGFAGNREKYQANDPLTLMTQRRYEGVPRCEDDHRAADLPGHPFMVGVRPRAGRPGRLVGDSPRTDELNPSGQPCGLVHPRDQAPALISAPEQAQVVVARGIRRWLSGLTRPLHHRAPHDRSAVRELLDDDVGGDAMCIGRQPSQELISGGHQSTRTDHHEVRVQEFFKEPVIASGFSHPDGDVQLAQGRHACHGTRVGFVWRRGVIMDRHGRILSGPCEARGVETKVALEKDKTPAQLPRRHPVSP